MFQHYNIHKYSWTSTDKKNSLIDRSRLVRQKATSILDAPFFRVAYCGIDQYLWLQNLERGKWMSSTNFDIQRYIWYHQAKRQKLKEQYELSQESPRNKEGVELSGSVWSMLMDVNLFGENVSILMENTEAVSDASKEIAPEFNLEQTKYMFITRYQTSEQCHYIKITILW